MLTEPTKDEEAIRFLVRHLEGTGPLRPDKLDQAIRHVSTIKSCEERWRIVERMSVCEAQCNTRLRQIDDRVLNSEHCPA